MLPIIYFLLYVAVMSISAHYVSQTDINIFFKVLIPISCGVFSVMGFAALCDLVLFLFNKIKNIKKRG